MRTAVIVSYFERRGFGFLRPDDDGQQRFFHISNFCGDGREPSAGMRVAYEENFDRRKQRPCAVAVKPL